MAESPDVLVLGGGIGGLSCAALLARQGHRVWLVERHHAVGGYAHSFTLDGFELCHAVQYLMGCHPGGPLETFIGRIRPRTEIGFNALDPDGFDHIRGEDVAFDVPSTTAAFCQRLAERFPDERAAIERYFRRVDAIVEQADAHRRVLATSDVLLRPVRHRTVLRHLGKTLAAVFDDLGLSEDVRFILAGQAGNLASPPSEASFLLHAGMQGAYCHSAGYPKRGMQHFVESITEVIEDAPGGRVLRGVEVTGLRAQGGVIASIETSAGTLRAGHYIANLDPAHVASLTAPAAAVRAYDYSDAPFFLFLGFEGVDLRDHGFGRHNVWFHSRKDIEREFDDLTRRGVYDAPWIFLSTPSLFADEGVLCAPQRQSLVMLTFVSPEGFGAAEARALECTFLDVLERHFVPGARDKLVLRHVMPPSESAARLGIPRGAGYGARLTPRNYDLRRMTRRSPWRNLSFIGATSAYPGVMPIIVGAMQLCDELDRRGLAAPLVV